MPRMTVALLGGLLVAMIAVFAMQLIFPPDEVPQFEGVQTFHDQGRRHLNEGETFDAYNSFPPTSGPQPAEGAAADVYLPDDEVIPAPAALLPLLERGGVVVYYDPDSYESADDPSGLLGAMQSLRQFRERLAVVPIEGLSDQHDGATIVLAAWRTLLAIAAWDAEGNDQLTAFLQNAPDGYYDRYRLERGDPVVSAGSAGSAQSKSSGDSCEELRVEYASNRAAAETIAEDRELTEEQMLELPEARAAIDAQRSARGQECEWAN